MVYGSSPGTALAQVYISRGKMDTSGIEPDPSRKPQTRVLSERDNQLHHVPLNRKAFEGNDGK